MTRFTGISCPAENACVADGSYWVNYLAGDERDALHAIQQWLDRGTGSATEQSIAAAHEREATQGKQVVATGFVLCEHHLLSSSWTRRETTSH